MANKKHNDPLEEFFKKKLQDYDIEFQEKDWFKLENRLDVADQHKSTFWKRYAAAAAILFVISILAYITYQQQQKINQLNERLTNNEHIIDPQNTPVEILPNDLFDFRFPGNEPKVLSDENSNDTQESDHLVSNSQNETVNNVDLSDKYSATSQSEQQTIPFASLLEPNIMVTRSSVTQLPEIDKKALAHFGTGTILDNGQGDFILYNGVNAKRSQSSQAVNTKNNLLSQTKSKLTIGILGGPDLSTVGGLSNFETPGYKLGVSVEYNLSKDWALSIGAIHSKVQYTARGNDYSPPQGYWSYGTIPDETIAQCFIIDIPISLKYNLAYFEHSRIYAGGGISSYIMLNEEYQFKYGGYNGSGQPDRWQERTGTRHWMSNAMVSLGFEQDISKDLSVRVEPFIKIPMREVGWGNVKLYSMGSLFSINYNLY